jgi:hypothetical protein
LLLSTKLVEHGSIAQGTSQAKGMRQLLAQGERLALPVESLVWIAKKPQGQRRDVPAAHSWIVPAAEKDLGAILLGIVEGKTLLEVGTGRA